MWVLSLDEQPDNELDRLYTADPPLYERIDEWLDRIEHDPTARIVRPRRFHMAIEAWCVTVPVRHGADYAILWELYDDIARVHYIGAASFV